MPMTINTNIASLNAQRYLGQSQNMLNNSLSRLSSGLRINSASDDAAGLAISNRMTAQIRGLNQAVRNANDGISLVQTAEGALNETTNILQRIRELAVQAMNDTNSTSDRTNLQAEVTQLKAEIDRIANNTEFNSTTLLNGDYTSTKTFQVGANKSQTVGLTINGTTAAHLYLSSINITTTTAASNALSALDGALNSISDIRAGLGAMQNRFSSTVANLQNVAENLSASRSRIMDADFANETAEMTKAQILIQSGTAMLAQANQLPQQVLSLLG
jgi:flagellin